MFRLFEWNQCVVSLAALHVLAVLCTAQIPSGPALVGALPTGSRLTQGQVLKLKGRWTTEKSSAAGNIKTHDCRISVMAELGAGRRVSLSLEPYQALNSDVNSMVSQNVCLKRDKDGLWYVHRKSSTTATGETVKLNEIDVFRGTPPLLGGDRENYLLPDSLFPGSLQISFGSTVEELAAMFKSSSSGPQIARENNRVVLSQRDDKNEWKLALTSGLSLLDLDMTFGRERPESERLKVKYEFRRHKACPALGGYEIPLELTRTLSDSQVTNKTVVSYDEIEFVNSKDVPNQELDPEFTKGAVVTDTRTGVRFRVGPSNQQVIDWINGLQTDGQGKK